MGGLFIMLIVGALLIAGIFAIVVATCLPEILFVVLMILLIRYVWKKLKEKNGS